MKTTQRFTILILLTAVTCLCISGLSAAPAGTPPQDNWDIRVGLPLWVAGLKGTVGVHGRDAHIDEDFSDVADILDFAAALNLEIRKQRWLFFVNSLYAKTSADAQPGGLLGGVINDAELEQKQLLVDFGLGYNLLPREPFSLELFAGGRVQYLDAEISVDFPASSASFSGSKTWADPIFGLIVRYQISRPFTLLTEADVGGFGVSSDLTWQVNAGVEWTITRLFYLRGSYRHLDTDFEDGGFKYNLEQSGPQLELGLRF